MTPLRATLLNILAYGILPSLAAVTAGLITIGAWRVAVVLAASAAVALLVGALLWRQTGRPRLFWYYTVVIHWPLWLATVAGTGFIYWLYSDMETGEVLISRGWDGLIIVAGLLVSAVMVSWRLPLLWKALTPARVDETQLETILRYVGAMGDQVGRGSPFKDQLNDAVFELEMRPLSQHHHGTNIVDCILLQQCNTRWVPLQQQWIAVRGRRFLWPLGVCSASGDRLNPGDSPLAVAIEGKTVLKLFASDWTDKGSDWFAPGRRFLVTVYFSDNTWAEARTIIPDVGFKG